MEELKQYKQQHKNFDVPKEHNLKRWVDKQRLQRKTKKLPVQRYEKLKEVGFWEKRRK